MFAESGEYIPRSENPLDRHREYLRGAAFGQPDNERPPRMGRQRVGKSRFLHRGSCHGSSSGQGAGGSRVSRSDHPFYSHERWCLQRLDSV